MHGGRKPRRESEGAFYHVITRGNYRQKIFKEEDDFRRYLEIISEVQSGEQGHTLYWL